jgi:hypothetical protein
LALSRYYLGRGVPGLLMGFAASDEKRLAGAVDHLAMAWESGLPRMRRTGSTG